MYFWKPTETVAAHTVKLPENARDLSLHTDGTRLGIAFFDGAFRLYDLVKEQQA